MTTHNDPKTTTDDRIKALEERVSVLEDALRVLAHGLQDLPAAEPEGRRVPDAARQAHDLLLAARPGEPPQGSR